MQHKVTIQMFGKAKLSGLDRYSQVIRKGNYGGKNSHQGEGYPKNGRQFNYVILQATFRPDIPSGSPGLELVWKNLFGYGHIPGVFAEYNGDTNPDVTGCYLLQDRIR